MPVRNRRFIKSQILQILNLKESKCFWESFIKRAQIPCENSKQFWSFFQGRRQNYTYPLETNGYQHGTRHKEIYFWELILVVVLYFVYYDTLLQNATDIITKCHSYLITKCDKILLQNAPGFLLQNGTVVLQNETVITKCVDFLTKCDIYYKMRCLLQNASVQKATNSKF